MKTVLSLQSQLDLACLEGSSVTTSSMLFQVSILDMLFSATKCLQITFLSNFGSPLVPRGGVRECTFSCFFELWAILGPKCLQGLHQEPPEPPQASLFTDFWELVEQISKISRHPECQRASKKITKKGQHSVLFLNIFW